MYSYCGQCYVASLFGLKTCKIYFLELVNSFCHTSSGCKDAIPLCSLSSLFYFYQKNMTRKQRRKLEAEREDAEDFDDGPDSEADEEVTIHWRPN